MMLSLEKGRGEAIPRIITPAGKGVELTSIAGHVKPPSVTRGIPGVRPAMSKENQLKRVLESGIIAIVRSPDSNQLVEVAKALHDGGVSIIEITMTVPGAIDVLKQVQAAL